MKAFNCVKYENLGRTLDELEINVKDLRIIQNLYWNQKAAIRENRKLGD